MKKIVNVILVICMLFTLSGCDKSQNNAVEKKTEDTNTETTEIVVTCDDNRTEQKYMVMLEDMLYVDTGETNSLPRCGNMDFDLKYTGLPDKTPSENGQVNCKVEMNGGQHSWRENRIEIFVDDEWHIFAYNENNLDGVTMRVTESTDSSVTLEIVNETDKDIQYGDDFILEKKDNDSGEWRRVQTIIDDYGFNDIAHIVQKGTPSIEEIDFEWLYGKLEAGTYRIVKELIDYKGTGENINYWYSAEFMVGE